MTKKETFGGLSTGVVTTGTGICDKGLMSRQNRVAKQFTMCHWPTHFRIHRVLS